MAGEGGLSGDTSKQPRIRVVPDEAVRVELANGSAEEEDIRHESSDPGKEIDERRKI